MSVYYTGKGDDGISHVGLKKIAKTDLIMDVLGDLDELNALLGIIKNLRKCLDFFEKMKTGGMGKEFG